MAPFVRTLSLLAAFAVVTQVAACGGTTTTPMDTSVDFGIAQDLVATPDFSPITNACTGAADEAVINTNPMFQSDVFNCTLNDIVQGAGAIASCIASKDHLSSNCASCYETYGICGAQHCLTMCTGPMGSAAPACDSCFAASCGDQFMTCTGLPPLIPDGGTQD